MGLRFAARRATGDACVAHTHTAFRLHGLVSLLLAVVLPLASQGPAVDLEHKGEGYPVYRIPALVVTTKGTLIAAYDGRPSGADVPSNIAVLVRRSSDGGTHWTPRQVVRADSAPLGFGDPSLLVDRQTGRIFLFYVASHQQGFFGAGPGVDDADPNVLHAEYSWSDDDGRSWQHRRITAAIKDPAWGGLFASSGAGIQLQHGPHAGRLIQQYVVRFRGGNYGASAYSDDHGATWRMGSLVGPGVDENKTVELADGRVMLNSRAKGFRKVAISTDGGVTYGPLHDDSTLVDPANNGAILRLDPTAKANNARAHRLLFSNTAHPTQRTNFTLRLSCDDGTTWPASQVIDAGRSAYSTITMLDRNTVGVLYERGDYEWISFRRVDVRGMVKRCEE